MKSVARIAASLMCLGVLGGTAGAGRQGTVIDGEAITVDALLEAIVRAHGGPALEAVTTERRVGTVLRGVFGKVPFEVLSDSSGRWRWLQTFAWGDRVAFGFDGSRGWIQDSTGTKDMSSGQLVDLQLLLDPQAPLKLSKIFPEMEVSGFVKFGSLDAVRVHAISREGVSRKLLFDRQTGLLLGAGDMWFEDYREVDGVQRPFRVLLGRDRGEEHRGMKMETSEIYPGVELEGGVFRATACPLVPVEPPLYTHRPEVEVDIGTLEARVGVYQHPTAPGVTFSVTRQGRHLMFQSSGGGMVEIKPQSETDFFVQFLNLDFHFARDETGAVTHLELGPSGAARAPKIK
jgi:hypothetical protein